MATQLAQAIDVEQEADPLEGSAIALAITAAQAAKALIGLRISALGLVPGQDRLLLALERQGTVGLTSIAHILNVRPSTVSKMMDRLTERGLARRVTNADDLRRISVELTDLGLNICKEVRDIHRATDAELRSKLSEADMVRLLDSLTTLNAALTMQLRRQR